MAKKLTEEEMRKEVLKDPEIRKVRGVLKDVVPEAVAEYKEKEKRKHAGSTDG